MILPIIIGLASVALVMLYLAAQSRAEVEVQRLDTAMHSGGLIMSGTDVDTTLSRSIFRRLIAPPLRRMADRVGTAVSPRWAEATRVRLERAGHLGARATAAFLGIKVAVFLLGVGAVLLVVDLYHGSRLSVGLISVVLVLGAMHAPEGGLNMIIRKRQDDIKRSLPDVIDLLAVSAEAGTGLDGALATVSRRKPGPLSDEFNRLLLEVRLGKSREEAWNDLAERVDLPELRAFVSALEQAEEMGVSIANTLRVQSDAIRVKHALLIRQQAATLALKMLFPLVFCILPALFVVVLGPGFISIQRALTVLR